MAKRCDVCGKKVVHGNRKVHKHSKGWRYRAPKTPRVWIPNLRDVHISTEIGGIHVEGDIRMCMGCYKRYTQVGVAFLKKKNMQLYRRLLLGKLKTQ